MTLEYHNGREMNPEPINIPLAAVRTYLMGGMPVKVILEPGDGTKYVLAIIPDQGSFWVMRMRALKEGMGAWMNLKDPDITDQDITEVAGGNEWSKTFLRWWLERLIA